MVLACWRWQRTCCQPQSFCTPQPSTGSTNAALYLTAGALHVNAATLLKAVLCREAVLEKLYGSFQCMSQHKFASNVVEVCLARGNTKQRDRVVGEILNEGGNSQEQLQIMMKDQFGNYVIQKVLEVSLQAIQRCWLCSIAGAFHSQSMMLESCVLACFSLLYLLPTDDCQNAQTQSIKQQC